MRFTVTYFVREEDVACEPCPETSEQARRLAERAMKIGTSDRVEVTDSSGKLVYRLPRVLHST